MRTVVPKATETPRSFAWLLIGASVVGLAVGIGVGLRGLRAGVSDAPTLLGLVVLVAALGSLVFGIWLLLAGRTPGGRLGLGAATVFVVGVVVWTVTPAVIASYVPELDHSGVSPKDLGLNASEVTFSTADGVESWAWYVPTANGRTVIVRHGSGSTADSVLSHAAVLVQHGYGVLLTDARGHGNSGGTGMDFGWFGSDDIEAAVDFLEGEPEVDPGEIAVVGLSMGGEEAIGAIGDDSRIAAAVAEGVSARTDADKAWLSDVYGWRGLIQERLEWVQYTLADVLTPATKPESLASAAVRAAPRPILLIAGEEMPDEVNAASFIAAESSNVEVWIAAGAGHIEALAVAPDDWERIVLGFLEDVFEGR